MRINSNEVPIQNQLAMGGGTYKFIYMLKPFNLTCALLRKLHTYTQFLIKQGRWQIKIDQPGSDTVL